MNKPILCLDFDGVIHSYTSGWKGPRTISDPPVPGALEFMLHALENGWRVVIHSSRAQYWFGRFAMRNWLYLHAYDNGMWHEMGFGPGLEDVEFSISKPSALITLDDRAITFNGTWPSISELKAFKPWNKK